MAKQMRTAPKTATRPDLRLVLYQPDIPQNCGALIRLGACLGVGLDLIEPFGFLMDDRRLRRAGLDYHDLADCRRHRSWAHYRAEPQGRLVLLTTQASTDYLSFTFRPGDRLLLGRESSGVPESLHREAEARIVIPLLAQARSLNVALAAAMVVGEALRQLKARGDEREWT
ncbi:MAG: tRNA (cytidine(34)-2'-O)-methyltransferase [Rhodospirillales bacterium]